MWTRGVEHSRRPKANTEERSGTCTKFSPPARAAVQKRKVLEVRKHKNMIARALSYTDSLPFLVSLKHKC